MKLRSLNRLRAQRAYAIALVLIFLTLSFLVLMSALGWCRSNSEFNERNNQYFRTVSAAEAATEKVLANLSRDYQQSGEGTVYSKLGTYRTLVPTVSESSLWDDFVFMDPQNNLSQVYVDRMTTATNVPLESQYQGIYGLASTYRVISNAKMKNSRFGIPAALKQEVQLATIPVFQFAIFYSIDLEINPGPEMKITGRVHSNSKIYMQPQDKLTFQSHVTAADAITHNKSPDDPQVRNTNNSRIIYLAEHDANVGTLNLPIGTNNTPESVRSIMDIPPTGESATSQMGQQRYYNQADMIILVSNNNVKVTSGVANNCATTIPYCEWTNFFSTNVSFINKRENNKTIKTSQVDVGKLKSWIASPTNSLSGVLTHSFNSIYVADMRTTNSTTGTGVYVVNGQTLPDAGLTVATPNPIYVKGNYNVPTSALGTTNTINSKPASLVGDAITILSKDWKDTNSSKSLDYRIAGDTTVNAALLGGIVKSGNGYYSGGVENFPRFLEDWTDKTLTYNGSMVVMYYSRYATSPWGGSDVYNPPDRNWAFDLNYMDPAKLPPCTPQLRVLIRAQWAITKPGTTS
jgi:hypothetical protein